METFRTPPDRDGDYFEADISEELNSRILLSVWKECDGVWGTAYVGRDSVIALRDWLNRWIDRTPETEGVSETATADGFVTEDRVRELIAEAITPVPLHQSPQADLPADPEPHDVGHPDLPAEVLCNRTQPIGYVHHATRCTWCGFLWTDHPTFAEQLVSVADAAAQTAASFRPLVGCECGHRWAAHSRAGCTGSLASCRCTRPAPNTGGVQL